MANSMSDEPSTFTILLRVIGFIVGVCWPWVEYIAGNSTLDFWALVILTPFLGTLGAWLGPLVFYCIVARGIYLLVVYFQG